jgi:hypothetical protein
VKLLGKFGKPFFGPLKLLMVSLLTKCKNVHINSNLFHVIMSPNNGVEITLFCGKIRSKSRFPNHTHIHKQALYDIYVSLCHRFLSVSLTVMSDSSLLKKQFKNVHNLSYVLQPPEV